MEDTNIKLSDSERQKCEIWTRVMGYYRPVENFNVGKFSEYKERKYFKNINNIKDNSNTSCDCECINKNNTK